MFKKILSTMILCVVSISATPRIYIDENEFDKTDCEYHIHMGDNVWFETKVVHMNTTGLFTYERDLVKSKLSSDYEKKWKCPYCNRYWLIGQACQNKDCPSKYKW